MPEDPVNLSRAESNTQTYPAVVGVLVRFMGKQVQALLKATARKTTFRTEGAVLLLRAVRSARQAGHQLPKAAQKLWQHIEETLRSDAAAHRQLQGAITHYCRMAVELAQGGALGYTAELRGDLLRRLLRALLQPRPVEAQAAALDAAAQIHRGALVDLSGEVPLVCQGLVDLVQGLGDRNQNAVPLVGCLAAVATRSPFAFRDWLLGDGRAELLAGLASRLWSIKTLEGLSLVLRLALGFQAPASELIPMIVDSLESLWRSDDRGSPPTVDARQGAPHSDAVRMADLLASLLLRSEGSSRAAAQRLCEKLEHRVVPWALCAVRLCEAHAGPVQHGGLGDAELLQLVAALGAHLTRGARPGADALPAVYLALAAALTAHAWARLWPAGVGLPSVPVPLSSVCGDALVLSAAPGLVSLPPLEPASGAEGAEWARWQQALAEHAAASLSARPAPRGLHRLLGVLLIAAPRSAVEDARCALLRHAAQAPAAVVGQSDAPARCCLCAAVRRQRPDPKAQCELLKGVSAEAVDVRVAFLALCAADSLETQEEDDLCAVDVAEEAPSCVDVRARWRERHAAALGQLEAQRLAAALDAGHSDAGGALVDELRLHAATQAASFREPVGTSSLRSADPEGADARLLLAPFAETSKSAAVYEAALKLHFDEADAFLSARQESLAKALPLAAQLLPTMGVALRLPHDVAAARDVFCPTLICLLDLACQLLRGHSPSSQRAGAFFDDLADLVWLAAALARQGGGGGATLSGHGVWPKCLVLAEAIRQAWLGAGSRGGGAPRSRTEQPDLFDGGDGRERRRESGARQAGTDLQRSSGLRLLLALACAEAAQDAKGGPRGEGCEGGCPQQVLRGLLLDCARAEPAAAVQALGLAAWELAGCAAGPAGCPAHLLAAVAECWCAVDEPMLGHQLDEMLLSALRLVTAATRISREALQAVSRHLWVGGRTAVARLTALSRRLCGGDIALVSPQGKQTFAALLTNCIRELKGVPEFNATVEFLAECCMSTIPDLILTDGSCEVRFSVGSMFTRALFDFFNVNDEVFNEFAQSLTSLEDGGEASDAHPTSSALATVRVMVEVACQDGYMARILPRLCALAPGLRPTVRLALRSLDEPLGPAEGGCSWTALAFRTGIFAAQLRRGHQLTELRLEEFLLALPSAGPRAGVGRHFAAAVAALALCEETGQLPQLAEAVGARADSQEFHAQVFVPLAGTLLPLQRSLQPLRRLFSEEWLMSCCSTWAASVFAFALQLPFLTLGLGCEVDARRVATALAELHPALPWARLREFVNQHFRLLCAQLDRIMRAWSRWAPATAVDMLRTFAGWLAPLSGSRLRLFLPLLRRQADRLPPTQSKAIAELAVVVETVVSASGKDALVHLAAHQDESLGEAVRAVERKWSMPSLACGPAANCPALSALRAAMRRLRRAPEVADARPGDWLFLQVESILPGLSPAAQEVLAEARGLSEAMDGSGRPVKRRRLGRGDSTCAAAAAVLHPGRLAWGAPPDLDLGAVARCAVAGAGADPAAGAAAAKAGAGLARVLHCALRPQMAEQMARDGELARTVALSVAATDLADVARLDLEAEGEALDGFAFIDAAMREERGAQPTVDELLCCGALLGATQLQVHRSAAVRRRALAVLHGLHQQQPQLFGQARDLLHRWLDPQHLCLEDLHDISIPGHLAPRQDSEQREAGWPPFHEQAGSDFPTWVRDVTSRMMAVGAGACDATSLGVMAASVPLARSVDWFAKGMLVLVVLKAADSESAGKQFAEALNCLFRQENAELSRLRAMILSLRYIRSYQTVREGRVVPHFPMDSDNQFWSALDLRAVAESASRVGWARDGLLYLELHLAMIRPDDPIDQTLVPDQAKLRVDQLFSPPTPEVKLLHRLAEQLPDDELLHGSSQWCHPTSRLVRAELGHDHLATLHLRSELRAAALHARRPPPLPTAPGAPDAGEGDAGAGLQDALARLGLHGVLAGEAPPMEADAAVWERRAESLWRLRQWDPVSAPSSEGFQVRVHGALCSIAAAASPSRGVAATAAAALERPLLPLVAQVSMSAHAGSPEQQRWGSVRLGMLGSIFSVLDAKAEDAARGSRAASRALSAHWAAAAGRALPARHFLLLEPLHALRAALLSLVAEPDEERKLLVRAASAARAAAQSHRALGLLEQAHRVPGCSQQRLEVLKLHWERAQCLRALQQQEAVSIARAISAECRQRPHEGAGVQSWAASVLSETGHWLSVSRQEGPDVIQREYLERAVAMDPAGGQPRRQLADFLDARFSEELARQSSLEHTIAMGLRKATEQQLQGVRDKVKELSRSPVTSQESKDDMGAMREQQQRLESLVNHDQAKAESEKKRLQSLAVGCVTELGNCLAEGTTGNLTKVACRLLSLWFYCKSEYPEVTSVVRQAIPRLALRHLTGRRKIPFIYQLASRLDLQEGPFQDTLDDLLVRLAAHSAPALWPLLALRNGDQVQGMRGAGLFQSNAAKIKAAQRVLDRLCRDREVRRRLQAHELVSRFYLEVAFCDFPDRRRAQSLTALATYGSARGVFSQVQVPTIAPSSDGSPAPVIKGIEESFRCAAQGLSAPRVLVVHDADGGVHRQLVKGKDDSRQDAVMQQVFRLLNDVFMDASAAGEGEGGAARNLRLRTYQVVPLAPSAGILEWVVPTATLGELLVGNSAAPGAHPRYRPLDWPGTQCREVMGRAREAVDKRRAPASVLEAALLECYANHKPVMHLVFMELFPSPAGWHAARQHFARSAAVSSMVGYILGIGDRHTNNILLDTKTGELVHIDFGITFEAGRALRVPELVPFRMTRDMVAGLGCMGTGGCFRRCCETSMQRLRDSAPLVNAVVDVFVQDPTYQWRLSAQRAQSRQQEASPSAEASAPGGGPDAPTVARAFAGGNEMGSAEGNEMARRALQAVQGKLRGEHDSASMLGVPAHVGWVIQEATSIANLAAIFPGWSQWV
ncbi:unnamed protein product [Prorocentrum cordatum]|uniref:non-specific serine/threonine protein kinase n=1 Tax=Prorocentrum cordatum TaxID=2364126 RepID=A0ABN9YAX6_9DINO|nr:unnamed protein product [Polarella glacialis]